MTGPADTIIGHALQGLNRAFSRADSAAQRVAQNGPDAEAAVDLMTAEQSAKANAAVVKTADEMQQHLIDILA